MSLRSGGSQSSCPRSALLGKEDKAGTYRMEKPLRISTLIKAGYAIANAEPKSWPMYSGGHLNRGDFVTASEAANCSRRIKYGKQGQEVPFTRWGFAERGNVLEDWMVDKLRLSMPKEFTLLYAGSDQVSFANGHQSGTPDGLIRDAYYNYYVLELKSIDPRTNKKKLPKLAHVAQLQQNMYLVNSVLEEGSEVLGGVILYLDASDLQDMQEFWIEPDYYLQEELIDKAELINAAASPDDLPPEGITLTMDCGMCDYADLCSGAIVNKEETKRRAEQASEVMNDVFK